MIWRNLLDIREGQLFILVDFVEKEHGCSQPNTWRKPNKCNLCGQTVGEEKVEGEGWRYDDKKLSEEKEKDEDNVWGNIENKM